MSETMTSSCAPPIRRDSNIKRQTAALTDDALLGEKLLKLAGLEHLADDIAAADEFALHVKLGNGRPVRKVLMPLRSSADPRTFRPL